MKRLLCAVLLSLAAVGASGAAAAQAHATEVGIVIAAVGRFSAIQPTGEIRPLARRAPIFNGDTLVTGGDARAQVRFSDGTLVALRPDSQFRVDDFRFDGTTDGDENAAFTLLKGGMRTITGIIGKQNHERYSVRTDVATIGIRGTHYVLHQCGRNCGQGEAGLYGGVVKGAIVVTNGSGATVVASDQFFHVSDAGAAPQMLLAPPSLLFSGEQQTEAAQGGDTEGDAGPRAQSGQAAAAGAGLAAGDGEGEAAPAFGAGTPLGGGADGTVTGVDVHMDLGTDPVPENLESTVPLQQAPAGAVIGVAFVSHAADDGYRGDGSSMRQGEGTAAGTTDFHLGTFGEVGNVPAAGKVYLPDHTETVDGVTAVVAGCAPCTLWVGQATLEDTGGLSGIGMGVNWGRWEGDYLVTENGQTMTTVGGLHYIYSPNETPYSTVSAMTGSAYYDLVGGTRPTDEYGVAGALTGAYVGVDFGTQSISSVSLYGDVNGKSFSAYSTAAVPLAELYQVDSGIDLGGSCYGGACGTSTALHGRMSANFVGPDAERLIGVYGLNQDGSVSGVAISGTVALER